VGDRVTVVRVKLYPAAIVHANHQPPGLDPLDRPPGSILDADRRSRAVEVTQQAAKEVGNAYTDRREISGPGGGAPLRKLVEEARDAFERDAIRRSR
jgi:hypothetical protein